MIFHIWVFGERFIPTRLPRPLFLRNGCWQVFWWKNHSHSLSFPLNASLVLIAWSWNASSEGKGSRPREEGSGQRWEERNTWDRMQLTRPSWLSLSRKISLTLVSRHSFILGPVTSQSRSTLMACSASWSAHRHYFSCYSQNKPER